MDQITFFGLDLGEYYSQISYYRETMQDVVSISPKIGSKSYLIPTAVAKRPGLGQWFIGEDALKYPEKVTNLLTKAYKRQEVTIENVQYPAIELLTLYIRRILSIAASVGCDKERDYFIICIDHASKLAIETLLQISNQLGIKNEQVKICSRQEAFCYYVMNQEEALRVNDVLLMDYWENSFKVYQLKRDKSVIPNVVNVTEVQISGMKRLEQQEGLTREEILEYKESVLTGSLDEILGGKLISTVYLVGNGFEGEWMKQSLSRLCAGRRVFSGMNLYTKGACYYGKTVLQKGGDLPEYLYLGGGNLLYNICVKVFHQQEYQYHVLIPAGYNWQDARGAMEVIITGEEEPGVEITCKSLKGGEDIRMNCSLTGLNVSKDKTTRLCIEAQASSPERIKVCIKHIGFGEIVPAKNISWDFEIKL